METEVGAEYESGGYLGAGLQATAFRLSALTFTAVVIHDTPERVPFQGGWTLSYAVIGFIPRIIWPGKPIFDVGQFITDTYGAGTGVRTSTGTSWTADFYMNFGIPGVVIGMAFMGFYIRIVHEFLFTSNTTPALFAATIFARSSA